MDTQVNDRYLNCKECSASFLFSAGEQLFFAERGLTNEPKRCPNCRSLMRFKSLGVDESKVTTVNCAECQGPAIVPFVPRGHRPIYCSGCLKIQKERKREEMHSGDAFMQGA